MNYKSTLADSISLERTIKRIAHQIIEKNKGVNNIVLVGIKTRGIPFALRLQENLKILENVEVTVEALDITLYRDDLTELNDVATIKDDLIKTSLQGKDVILCDDVIFTGRTTRAAIDAVMKHGRPKSIQLAVLVDRGHRELPIRADYVGLNVPTSLNELISVKFNEIDGVEKIDLYQK